MGTSSTQSVATVCRFARGDTFGLGASGMLFQSEPHLQVVVWQHRSGNMDLHDLISPDAVMPALIVDDKRHALQAMADTAARVSGIKARDVFAALWQREMLGSTGIGRGIAIPHGRISAVTRMTCVFARLEKPVAFDSIDGEAVDLMFLLLAPEHAGADHLKALARIARLMREPKAAEKLRASRDRAALYAILTQPSLADLPKAG
jgi:nitrogen PTS system EIIA component